MKDDTLFDAWINPLAFLEVDEPWAGQSGLPDYNDVFDFLCAPGIKSDIDSMITRYREISREPKRLFAAPAEERILNNLVWPLLYAKSCYMLGNYLGTIALCGTVAEMVAILLYDVSHISINGSELDGKAETNLFGTRFEKLGQERRVSVLRAFNLIDDNLKSSFDIIRDKRRRYLHLYSQDFTQLAPDAIEVFNATVKIVVEVIGQDIQQGKIILKPAILNYLKQTGIAKLYKQDSAKSQKAENEKSDDLPKGS